MNTTRQTRYIFITGGVVSSLGKGIAAAALAALLQARGFSIRLRKLDPYLNVDPGTMNPRQHGECFVTDDGAETDLDLGHYERFSGVNASRADNITSGQIYQRVLDAERRGDYLGSTVQVIPHVTDTIKQFIQKEVEGCDFVICEIGGTVGDIEGLPFLEAIRQLRHDLGRMRTCFLHVTLVPFIRAAGELKTKPTQHSVKELLQQGIQADVLLCRSQLAIPAEEREKISRFCNIAVGAVIEAPDIDSIYQAPLCYHEKGLDREVLKALGIDGDAHEPDLQRWRSIERAIRRPDGVVRIAVVGKYVEHQDAYKSLNEALIHGGVANSVAVERHWIHAGDLEQDCRALGGMDAVLIPGGFGVRGVAGKMHAIRFARERHIPFLGICFGMQLAVIEICRHMLDMPQADSTEFGACQESVVGLLREWVQGNTKMVRDETSDLGGTMRLGGYDCLLQAGSMAARIYGATKIRERHRHRYEVNVNYREQLHAVGAEFTGMSPNNLLPEILEMRGHPWFMGVQFHPELKSRPFAPHPIFADFVRAAMVHSRIV